MCWIDWDYQLYLLYKDDCDKEGVCIDCNHLIKDCNCDPYKE